MNQEEVSEKRKRNTFGAVFLTIFLDMVGFSVIFPLFPSMLEHYLERESLLGGGWVTSFVYIIKDFAFVDSASENTFRFETVIFGGALFSTKELYNSIKFFKSLEIILVLTRVSTAKIVSGIESV